MNYPMTEITTWCVLLTPYNISMKLTAGLNTVGYSVISNDTKNINSVPSWSSWHVITPNVNTNVPKADHTNELTTSMRCVWMELS